MALSPVEREAAESLAAQLRGLYGSGLRAVKVFGSRARGEARPDSDLDILVLLDRADWREQDRIAGLAYDLMLERGYPFVFSTRVMGVSDFQALVDRERLFPREIERDGIAV